MMRKLRILRAVLALVVLVAPRPALAHLMSPSHGTLNVVDDAVFSVIAVPASALHGYDDDGDGLLDVGELERHHAELEAEVDRRFVLADGEARGTTLLVNLFLSPQHDGPADRADGLVALVHTRFARPVEEVTLACDLFGARESERQLTIKATRQRGGVAEVETAIFTAQSTSHGFFRPVAVGFASSVRVGAARVLGGAAGQMLLVLTVVLAGVGAVAASRRRASSPSTVR